MISITNVRVQKTKMTTIKKTKKTATPVSPTADSKEMAVVKAQATKATTYATNLAVVDEPTYKAAMEEGKNIKEFLKSVTGRKEEITRPLNDALKSTRELFKPFEETFDAALTTIRNKMTIYYRQEAKRAEVERNKIADRVERGSMKTETGIRKMDDVKAPEQTVKSDSAAATMRTVQKWRVIDKSKIPLIFMEPNMLLIKAEFKAGTPVPGVEQYEESELAIS